MAAKKSSRETRQRVVILDELRRTRAHPTADELYEAVKRRLPRISLGTVYRNLDLLAGAGRIRRLQWAGDQRRYDADMSEHCHVRCTRCGRVDDVACGPPKDIEATFRHETGYRITGHRLELLGLCPQCQRDEDA